MSFLKLYLKSISITIPAGIIISLIVWTFFGHCFPECGWKFKDTMNFIICLMPFSAILTFFQLLKENVKS